MAISSTHFSLAPAPASDVLLVAVFVSAVVHAVILLGINFTIPQQQKMNKQIEITFASMPVKKAPKKSNYLAQENQLAAGRKTTKSAPLKQKLPSQGNKQNRPANAKKSHIVSQPKSVKKVVTQQQAEEKILMAHKPDDHLEPERPKLSIDALQQQIAQLGAKIRHSQQSTEQADIKFVSSVSTHKYIASQYVRDWEQKIESVGNLNYPEVARKKGFSGTLTIDVGINADGSIYSIRITKSSGHQALDDAAKRIIRLSAPFAVLPEALLKELKVLVITRVWKFTDEIGMTTQ